jgi:N-acetyltransferase
VIGFDLQPHLVGDLLELRPLRAEDWDDLFLAGSDPLIWEGHPARDRYRPDMFRHYFLEALESGGALVALDRASRRIIGSSRFFWYGSDLEIGWTFLARDYWGGNYNREMKRLMLAHAFQRVERVIFLVATTNRRSRRALEKIGGRLTDRIEKRTIHGVALDHVVYEIRDTDLSP